MIELKQSDFHSENGKDLFVTVTLTDDTKYVEVPAWINIKYELEIITSVRESIGDYIFGQLQSDFMEWQHSWKRYLD